ncbi:MAG: hypothetical protein R6W76_18185 [Caldilinea sp.]
MSNFVLHDLGSERGEGGGVITKIATYVGGDHEQVGWQLFSCQVGVESSSRGPDGCD